MKRSCLSVLKRYIFQNYWCNFFFFTKNYLVVEKYCYYKYGYCYYCSPGKVLSIYLVFCIVIWSPAGQRHDVTMMNPSLHSTRVQRCQGVPFQAKTPTNTRSSAIYECSWCSVFWFFSWSQLELKLITNNDNGNNIYNDDHINKVELRFLNSCFSSLRCCFWDFSTTETSVTAIYPG